MSTATCECLASANELLAAHSALVSRVRVTQKHYRRQLRALPSPPFDLLRLPLIPSPPPSPPASPPSSPLLPPKPRLIRQDLPPAKKARAIRYQNYVPEEETIRNDYSQRYVDGGEWPQDWVLGADPEHRFEEYPKQQRLLALKKASVAAHALPPVYLPYSQLSTLHPAKFDIILIDPPFSSSFTWDDLQELPIPTLAADPSFVLMWVGSGAGEGLERGREVLAKWGFRRCEDIVWVKTNKASNRGPGTDPPTSSLLTRTKQHCLMGIRGTVRRSTDSWFVHCNVDTDVMIWEGDASDPTLKPPEMYTLIENFCLGLRRLEIFGRARTLRRGWVSALAEGEEDRIEDGMCIDADSNNDVQDNATPWNREVWENKVKELSSGGKVVVPMTPEIDALRPKSPMRGGSANSNTGMGLGVSPGPAQPRPNNLPIAMPMAGGSQNRGGFNNQNRMMMQPVMAMNNMPPAGDMGMMGWDMPMNIGGLNMPSGGMQVNNMNSVPMNGMGGMNSMSNMNNMNNMNNINNMNGMNSMNGMPMGMGQRGMGFAPGAGQGFGGFDSGQMQGNMNWMGAPEEQFVGAPGGMWDPSIEPMMGMNGMGGNVPMGGGMMNPGMNPNVGMNMGMRMGQWGGDGFDGPY
ncbi:MT-A70-domain-containing protein [Daedalea quercina L-15889]|uniref:MT-A70-domain-containing protein n=1 Tax=Daedalea quercina L-15889 TaxID=1314783 RepID=A0A165NAV8_9APHY|nr:MT-A70-domain-containing protein [Daedalea quercina L-15889]